MDENGEDMEEEVGEMEDSRTEEDEDIYIKVWQRKVWRKIRRISLRLRVLLLYSLLRHFVNTSLNKTFGPINHILFLFSL